MEHQGKTEKQVTDSEIFAFWGLVGLITCIVFLIITPSSSDKLKEELKESKLTIERLKRDRDSLVNLNDSLFGQLIKNQ